MKRPSIFLIVFLIFIISSDFTYSQTQSGAFSVTGAGYSTSVVTDYQCVGLNPANLGWKRNNHLMNIGFGETELSVYSEPLKRQFVNELFNADKVFTSEEKQQAVEDFTNTKLQFEGNIGGIGVSFQDEKIGGFAFTVKERLMWDSNLNEESSDILFRGYHADYFDEVYFDEQTGDTTGISTNPQKITELFEGTSLQMIWFREYNFSYGRSIIKKDHFSIYGGIGLKYLQGYSYFNYSYKDGVLSAISALNPTLGVDYDTPSPSKIENNEYQKIGQGFGFDIGISALIYERFRIAFSITDIGSITWDGNVYTGEDANLIDIQSAGINNYNIFALDDNAAFDNLKWGGWEGLEDKTTKLPMNMRAGGAFMMNDVFEFGTEFYIPLNEMPGSYDKLIFGVGTRIMPTKWFRGSIGIVSGGATGTGIPVGVSFFPFNNESFTWEMGIAVRDVTSYFSNSNPTLSFAMGFLRFSFGNLGKPSEGK